MTRALRLTALLSLASAGLHAQQPELRLGIIGADTSHAVEFTRIFNDASAKDHIPGARIVAVYKGGSPDVESSSSRIEKFSATLRDTYHLTFVDRIADLCPLVDGILLESVDGRKHLAQFKEAAACGKPVFIDKPLASTLADAEAIAAIAAEKHVPWFSASSLRWSAIQSMRSPQLLGAFVWSPGPLEPHHALDLSWYGVHGVEMLYTLMGPGATQVTRTFAPDSEVITAVWKDGRIGTIRLGRPYSAYGAVAFYPNNKSQAANEMPINYSQMMPALVDFMRTGTPPVPNAETLEMFRFMDAAQKSKDQGGIPIKLQQ
jgi:hypothetical protein